MSPAELAARRTAASAVLADYRRAANQQTDPGFSWALWAGRLACHLGSLLDDDAVKNLSKVPHQRLTAE